MIYVIGDSHTRSFANNHNFFPLFIGPGKEMCFISDAHLNELKKRVSAALKNLEDNAPVLFVLGEPDTRYYLGKGWTPWEPVTSEEIAEPFELLSRSAQRYGDFLTWAKKNFNIQILVFNITPSERIQQNKYVDCFNKKLRIICSNNKIPFIDIMEDIMNHDSIKSQFMADVVHLDLSVQSLIEEKIKQAGFELDVSEHVYHRNSKTLQSDFLYDERFSCFTYQPDSKSSFKKLFSKFRGLLKSVKGNANAKL